ncbi:MAG TPA: hypothetical protein VJS68_03595, partial [Thermoplasmata archaeon]|nr:hypothetical protein [Thermoplasmata archaeon]
MALTLTLFSSVFLFVSTFPKPSPQPSSQFQASLTYGGKTGTHIVAIQINHLTGPTLTQTTTQFIFFSQNASGAFSAKNPFHISDGLSGASQWTVGQVWVLNLPSNSINLFAPDNITISIISSGQLLFHQSIPGTNPAVPPQFLSEGTSPANPAVGAAFTIFTQVQDSNSLTSVTVNITQIPGTLGNPALPGAPTCNAARTLCKMSFNAVSGLYQFAIPVGVTNAGGSFFAFITATDSAGLTNSVVVPINLGSSGSGSGGTSPFSVSVATNPASPVKGVATTLVATVTNTGSSSGGITVSFTAQGAAVGSGSTATIGAGSSVVVVDGTNWVPGAVGATTVTATVSGIGTATATLAVTVFPQILLVAHSVASGGLGYGNTSAALETAL